MAIISPQAANCTSCSCASPQEPYSNLCCCPAINGITVSQPRCQVLPQACGTGGPTVVNNPCFCQSTGRSNWTYKFFTDCQANGISNILIPICENITLEDLIVYVRVDGCGQFQAIASNLLDIGKTFNDITAPQFYNWLKIDNDGRYDNGVCVTYLLSILGNFQVTTGPIAVKAGTRTSVFNCDPNNCFLVPGCIPASRLNLTKTATAVVNDANNTVTITYNVTITNPGPTTVTNLNFLDTQIVPTGTVVQNVTIITPPTVTATFNGNIIVQGPLPNLAPNASVNVIYTVTFGITQPGPINFTNTATAAGFSNNVTVSGSATANVTIEAVQVRAQKCCDVVNNNEVVFRVRISSVSGSPAATVNITDRLVIPAGLTINFPANAFDGCTAVFENDGPVPTGVDIRFTTARTIIITCNNISVPAGGFTEGFFRFTVVANSVFNCNTPLVITNEVTNVTPIVTTGQLSLNTLGIPATARVQVVGCVTCLSACNETV